MWYFESYVVIGSSMHMYDMWPTGKVYLMF
jgi:hypothetical protein